MTATAKREAGQGIARKSPARAPETVSAGGDPAQSQGTAAASRAPGTAAAAKAGVVTGAAGVVAVIVEEVEAETIAAPDPEAKHPNSKSLVALKFRFQRNGKMLKKWRINVVS